jgi:hypothetical protein
MTPMSIWIDGRLVAPEPGSRSFPPAVWGFPLGQDLPPILRRFLLRDPHPPSSLVPIPLDLVVNGGHEPLYS